MREGVVADEPCRCQPRASDRPAPAAALIRGAARQDAGWLRSLLAFEILDERVAVGVIFNAGEQHLGAGNEFFGIGQINIESLLIPRCAGVFVRVGVVKTGDRAGLAADDPSKARADLVLARLRGVADLAIFLEHGFTCGLIRTRGCRDDERHGKGRKGEKM
jgi:hypothetical protein